MFPLFVYLELLLAPMSITACESGRFPLIPKAHSSLYTKGYLKGVPECISPFCQNMGKIWMLLPQNLEFIILFCLWLLVMQMSITVQ